MQREETSQFMTFADPGAPGTRQASQTPMRKAADADGHADIRNQQGANNRCADPFPKRSHRVASDVALYQARICRWRMELGPPLCGLPPSFRFPGGRQRTCCAVTVTRSEAAEGFCGAAITYVDLTMLTTPCEDLVIRCPSVTDGTEDGMMQCMHKWRQAVTRQWPARARQAADSAVAENLGGRTPQGTMLPRTPHALCRMQPAKIACGHSEKVGRPGHHRHLQS